MYMPFYTLERIVEARLAELRAEAARQRLLAPAEEPTQPESPSRIRWIQVQIFGR